jgi:hypothetical protein
VATHPSNPQRIAVVYQRYGAGLSIPALRISHDAGLTWRGTTSTPWAASGRSPGNHAAIAWGPGPRPGSARLYWTDATIGADSLLLSIAWTDDEGVSWSKLYVERRTPPWIGGFPDITVDRDPSSPNYGAVYVAYNWLADARRGPGLRVLASADYGQTWRAVEVAAVPAPAGYPAAWRIDYRVRTAPDGGLYVAFFQANLRRWDSRHAFRKGSLANVGRVGFAIARVELDRSSGRLAVRPARMAASLARNAYTALAAATPGTIDNLTDPTWSLGLDVDPSSGRVFLAVGDYQPAAHPRGTVRVGRSDDQALTWTWTVLAPLADVDGRAQSSYRPNVAAVDGRVFVGVRGITDVAKGSCVGRRIPTIGEAYAVSLDAGRTFTAPSPISPFRWNAAALKPDTNGPGLRERADRTVDGRFVYVYADGRSAAPAPDPRVGRAAVYIGVFAMPSHVPGHLGNAASLLSRRRSDHVTLTGPPSGPVVATTPSGVQPRRANGANSTCRRLSTDGVGTAILNSYPEGAEACSAS